MREGRLSLDQVGVIAARAADGSDEHYAQLASVATVNQLRTAVSLEPRPDPEPRPGPDPRPEPESAGSITKRSDEQFAYWRITLPHIEAAKFEAALASHRDGLIAEWKRDRDAAGGTGSERGEHDPEGSDPGSEAGRCRPFPGTMEAFWRLVETGWDAEVARRPHGQHTTVVVHLDVDKPAAALHLGPLLSEADRQYLTCDATCEVWFERGGEPIGAGRVTRTVNRRLRRALEHRDRCCVVPGCGATRGLHPPHPAWGTRWAYRVGQPGSGVSFPSPPPSPRGDHHHRHSRRSDHHRRRRQLRDGGVAGPPADHATTGGTTMPRTHRRTRRLVVVSTLPTTTPTNQQLAGTGERGAAAVPSPERQDRQREQLRDDGHTEGDGIGNTVSP